MVANVLFLPDSDEDLFRSALLAPYLPLPARPAQPVRHMSATITTGQRRTFGSVAPSGKKLLQQSRRLGCGDSLVDLGFVMALRVAEHPRPLPHTA